MAKTITRKYKVYKFDELSDEAKEQAIDKLRDINVDYDWWQDDYLIDLSPKECAARHISSSEYTSDCLFTWKEIYFDIDRGSYLQFKNLVVNGEDVFRKFLRIPKKLWQNCQYSFNEIPSRQNNTELIIEPNFEDGREFTVKQQGIVDRAIEIFSDKIHEGLTTLHKQYEYLTSEDGIIETIEANDYDFFEDGRLFGSCC